MSGDPGSWVMPARFESQHVLELERRYRWLAEQRSAPRAHARISRLVSLAALLAVACVAAYLRYGSLRVRSLSTAELTVVTPAGDPACHLEASGTKVSLLIAHRGQPGATLEASDVDNHLSVGPKGSGYGVQASAGQYTTTLSLDHESAAGELFGIVSLGANLRSDLAIQGKDGAYAALSAAIGFGDMSRLQLVDSDVSNLDLSTFEGITHVTLGHALDTDGELLLFSQPSLKLGRMGGPTARMGLGETQLDVPDQGDAWLLAEDSGGVVFLTDDRLKSATHLRPTPFHRLGDGHPAELAP